MPRGRLKETMTISKEYLKQYRERKQRSRDAYKIMNNKDIAEFLRNRCDAEESHLYKFGQAKSKIFRKEF